jgi:hypothetical protein
MTFKKLTQAVDGSPIYIKVDEIAVLYRFNLQTIVTLNNGQSIYVVETVEEILP